MRETKKVMQIARVPMNPTKPIVWLTFFWNCLDETLPLLKPENQDFAYWAFFCCCCWFLKFLDCSTRTAMATLCAPPMEA